jgi:hypothetical protein
MPISDGSWVDNPVQHRAREAITSIANGIPGSQTGSQRPQIQGYIRPPPAAAAPLRVLSAGDVRSGLGKLAGRYSTRSLQITRNSL